MDSPSVAINTSISFIIHSLEELKKKGYCNLTPLIDKIEILHKQFRETESIEYIYKIIASMANYETYRDILGTVFTKLCEIMFLIVSYIKEKSLPFHELIVLKMFEFYEYLLKKNVKTYTKFTELEAIIVYIREDIVKNSNRTNMRENLNNLSYDDAVLRILVSLLCPPEENFSSFVELLDSILLPNRESVDKLNSRLKDFQISTEPVVLDQTLSPLELLKLKKKEKHDKLEKSKEDLGMVSIKENKSCDSLEEENNSSSESPVFTSTMKSSDSLLCSSYVPPKISVDKEEVYENPNDRLNRILNKYSKRGKITMDKSPPQGTNLDSMIRVMAERGCHS